MRDLARQVLGVPEKVDTGFYIQYLFFKHILRVNNKVSWPVHFTSRVARPERVKLGRGTYPGDMPGCYIQAHNGIEIGEYTLIAPNVGIISANHDPENLEHHLPAEPIRIGSYCWIGMNAVILPGVQLGDRTIVAAGSVVARSFPQGHCTIAGNPARLVKQSKVEGAQIEHR